MDFKIKNIIKGKEREVKELKNTLRFNPAVSNDIAKMEAEIQLLNMRRLPLNDV